MDTRMATGTDLDCSRQQCVSGIEWSESSLRYEDFRSRCFESSNNLPSS